MADRCPECDSHEVVPVPGYVRCLACDAVTCSDWKG